MKKVFVFDFCTGDEDSEEYFTYELSILNGHGIKNINSYNDTDVFFNSNVFDRISNFTDEMESEYGIHDFGTGERDDAVELIGYSTYEVEKDDIPVLLQKWKDELIRLGFTVGEWILKEDE